MKRTTILKYLALVASTVTKTSGKPAANLDFTPEFAAEHECDTDCQKAVNSAMALDRKTFGKDFDFDFYETAGNFSQSTPGDLLKLEAVDPKKLDIGAGTSVWRFQYTSLELDGETTVPSTGFIAFPYRPLTSSVNPEDQDKYRTIAYAHGTSGVYRGCAPSNGPALYGTNSWRFLVERGYVVVATDYAGLGNNRTSHKYCVFPTQANDVYYSVLAARQAFGDKLSADWMSVGHSEGGGAVWSLAENHEPGKSKRPRPHVLDGHYLGTVALAPSTRSVDDSLDGLRRAMQPNSSLDGASLLSYVPFLGLAVQSLYPDYNLSAISDKLRQRMVLADKSQLCLTGFKAITMDMTIDEGVDEQGLRESMPLFQEWQRRASVSGRPLGAPMLVVQGGNDTTVLPEGTRKAAERTCAQNGTGSVHLSVYPGVEHGPIIAVAAPEWLAWIDDRFSGRGGAAGHCVTVEQRPPFGLEHVKLSAKNNTSSVSDEKS